jgi:hypothetical protein
VDANVKPWSVLAYTVADDRSGGSPLDAAAQKELKAICDAANFAQVNIAAQVDFKRLPGVFRASVTSDFPQVRAFRPIRPQDHPLWRKILGIVTASRLRVEAERRDLNAARPGVLEEFLRYGRAECPADRYVVFFYGHACGPMGLFFDTDPNGRRAVTLRLNDLAGSMSDFGSKAAIVIFRDCFVNTLETAYQLRNVADYMIASQAVMPVAGVWPWVNLMAALMPGASSGDIARAIAMQLSRFLEVPDNRAPFADVPCSLLDLGEVDDVAAALNALVEALEDARADAHRCARCARALESARAGFPDDASRPGDPALLDVPTMCDALAALDPDPVCVPARALGELVRTRLVTWHGSETGAHRGTSLYYRPRTQDARDRSVIEAGSDDDARVDAEYYAKLDLSKATGWHRLALNPLAG